MCRRPAEALALLVLALAPLAARAAVADRLIVEGLQDVELFNTDDESRLLSLNEGDAAGVARLHLWIAGELVPGLAAVVEGEFEHGNTGDETEAEVEQAFLRYTPLGGPALRFEAGKMTLPLGNFSRRYLSSVNPLIGLPDSYDVGYPAAIAISGRHSWLDYRALAFDEPMANADYVPESDRAWRPGLAVGVTPMIGLRFGGYWTKGPYLGESVEGSIPTGEGWKEFDQEISGLELEWSRGHFELNGDLAFSSYEVPTVAAVMRGKAWYVEPKFTFTPHLYAALRLEYNDYPYIQPIDATSWRAVNAAFYDAEIGAGWRFTPGLQVKASYRVDRWQVDASRADFFPDGHAFAVQLSYGFDVMSWFDGVAASRD
jgi:hypothetical protein